MDTQIVVSTALVGLVSVWNWICVGWFWHRRDHQPIKYRWPRLVTVQQILYWSLNITFFIGIVGFVVQRDIVLICWLLAGVGVFIFPALLATVIVRVLILFLASKMVSDSERLEQQWGASSRKSNADGSQSGVQWYWKYRKYLNRYHYAKASILIFAVLSFPVLLAFASTKPATGWHEGCASFGFVFIVLISIETILASGLMFSLLPSVAKVHDNLGLRWESWGSIFTPPNYVVGFFLYVGTGSQITVILPLFFVIIPICISCSTSILLPLVQSFRIEKLIKQQKDAEKQNWIQDIETTESAGHDQNSKELLKFLSIPEGLQVIEAFARSEFSVENILFYKAVRNFKKCFSNSGDQESKEEHDANVWRMYKNICHQFVETDSPLCVNLRDDVRKKTLAPLNSSVEHGIRIADPKILDQALEIILQMFYFDTFSRFKLTEEFKQMSASIGKMSSLDEVSTMLGITPHSSVAKRSMTTV
jgi:hypothetical protein